MQRFLTSRSGAQSSTKTNGKTTASKKPEKLKSPILTEEYKTMIREASYLGKRGYTIPKASLTEEDMAFLKQDLFLKPEVPGAVNYGGANQDASAFPVYRESDKKLYIPRFYGVERYGHPARSEIEPGVDINVSFAKPLRDYQEQIVQTYLDAVCDDNPSGGILQVYTGGGKTVLAIKIAACLGKKTIIIVHKEFLMNQWIERLNEFMPTARIGKIQGNKCDIENKDIVIGMVQTLYNRTFPQEVYSQFGLTIIDEVHRIGSEEFSKTLLKFITPYMLGISATVERKDRLTKILYMFIGPIIYSTERPKTDIVNVRGIEFRTGDQEFNEVELDFRGKPKYSTMMAKLCEYGPRRDLILRVIEDLIKENPKAQMIVLGHYKNLLKELYEGIEKRGFASVGYYLGGMRAHELKESEEKQILISTYAMSSEGLDVKNLSILVLATPKSDIVQSAGRILRMKHENPIIVDIIDSHSVFKNQWETRRRYYKKCNYRIRYTTSHTYCGFTQQDWEKDWIKVYDPKAGAVIGSLSDKTEDSNDAEEGEEETEGKTNTIFGGKCAIQLENL